MTDLYTVTLVQDLKNLAPRYPGITEAIEAPVVLGQISPKILSQYCGSSRVVIYAGRHDRALASSQKYDDFAKFLGYIASCPVDEQPFIIADDGVARFIADPAVRTKLNVKSMVISYVTKGIAIMKTGKDCLNPVTDADSSVDAEFCKQYASIATRILKLKVQGQGLDLLWTGERVGLAYDAGELFLQAVVNYQTTFGEMPTAADLPDHFESFPYGYTGVTGTVRFTSTQRVGLNQADGMPMTIVRIDLSEKTASTATPICGYSGLDGQNFDLVPSHGCPDGYL